jgi:hypothetical protein
MPLSGRSPKQARTAQEGGFRSFAATAANGEVAPMDETALAVIGGRTRGLGSSGAAARETARSTISRTKGRRETSRAF